MSAFPDVLAMLCEQLPEGVDGVRTVVDLPPDFTTPIVWLAEIPGGGARDKPFNAPPITEQYDVDVDVFCDALVPDAVGKARDLAHEVRDWINLWSPLGISIDERSRPSRRPDYNKNVIRFGFTVRIVAARLP